MKAEEVLGGLLKVRGAALAKDKPYWWVDACGICRNLGKLIGAYKASNFVKAYSQGWSEYSGSPLLPVDGSYCLGNCWTGEYGAARLRLLDYLIQCVEVLGDSEIIFGEQND